MVRIGHLQSKRIAEHRRRFVEGDTVLSLIDRAGGIKAPGDLSRAYITRAGKDGAVKMTPIDLDALRLGEMALVELPAHAFQITKSLFQHPRFPPSLHAIEHVVEIAMHGFDRLAPDARAIQLIGDVRSFLLENLT